MKNISEIDKQGPELFIALVGPIGTELDRACTALGDALAELDYECGEVIRLSELLHSIPGEPWNNLPDRGSPEDERLHRHMDAGNLFRKKMERGDAVALLGNGAIRDNREEKGGDPNRPIPRHAYIFRSLKHPSEVETLRAIYGNSFFVRPKNRSSMMYSRQLLGPVKST